jgi:hypothetical protein
MEIKDILPMVLLIGVAIIGISIMSQILGQVYTSASDTASTTALTVAMGTSQLLGHTDIKAGSESFLCGAITLTDVTDYALTDSTGAVVFASYPRTKTMDNFTSLQDVNVTLSQTAPKLGSTFKVFNCTDGTAFDNTTDYNAYLNGKVNVLSTGTMANATQYCANYSYAQMQDGSSCTASYQFMNEGRSVLAKGVTSFSEFGNWFTIIVLLCVAMVVIPLIQRFSGRD